MILLLGALLLGWLLCAPVVWLARADMARYSRRCWWSTGHSSRAWRHRVLVAYAFGGWPGGVGALAWRLGPTRRVIREEAHWLERERSHPAIDLTTDAADPAVDVREDNDLHQRP